MPRPRLAVQGRHFRTATCRWDSRVILSGLELAYTLGADEDPRHLASQSRKGRRSRVCSPARQNTPGPGQSSKQQQVLDTDDPWLGLSLSVPR